MFANRIAAVLVFVLSAFCTFAEETVLLRFEGRGLTPGDKFSVSSTMQFAVIDTTQKGSPVSGGKAFDVSMAEYRDASPGKAAWTFLVPKDGGFKGEAHKFPFQHGIKAIPDRTTAYFVRLVISRNTVAPDGKPVAFTREMTFPVMVTEESTPKDLCVVFEGGPGGSLNLGIRPKCSDSVDPSTADHSVPARSQR